MDKAILPTDTIRDALASGDSDAIHSALHECLLFKSTLRFTPDQLDCIVPALDLEYRDAYLAVQILQAAAARQGAFPGDTDTLARRLVGILERYRKDPGSRPIVRHALHLLASLGDRAVISQLEYDAPRFDGVRARKEDYCCPVMVDILTEHDRELSALHSSFMKKKDFRAAKAVRAIREYANNPQAHEEKVQEAQDREVEVY